jgi:hypothetical protein
MYISLRQKIAGKAEAKKVTGLNFEEVRNKLISESIEPTRDEITIRLLDESNLVISNNQKDLILNLNLSENTRKRVNEIEAALIIIGAVLDGNNINGIIEDFNWYLETMEFKPGDLGITQEDIFNVSKIKESFNKIYNKVSKEKTESDKKAALSKGDSYLSNEVVYDFGDGWKVVYVPAAGEMIEFPGLSGTSHDRILEGNKNGLCLGSRLRFYQSNDKGKIYSIRDKQNKPRVTIRISEKTLQEAKGKNNNPPDIEAAEKADIWFKTMPDLNYKNNRDYKSFPPLNIKNATKYFLKNKDKAYDDLWVPFWYERGIDILDKDIDDKIKNFDSKLITTGFGKFPAFFEKIKSTVIYWCLKYVRNQDEESKSILFGDSSDYHQVFKIYKKLPEMKLAVKTLSENDENYKIFFKTKLNDIKEYEEYIYIPAKTFSEENPKDFINSYSEKPWAQPHLDLAAQNCAKKYPVYFLEDLLEKSWARHYVDLAAQSCAEIRPNYIISKSDKEWAKPYLDLSAKISAEKYPLMFLQEYSGESWAQPYLDLAVKNFIEKDPYSFLIYFSEKPWAQPYIDLAAKRYIEKDPYNFLIYFSKKPWAQPYLDLYEKYYIEEDPCLTLNHYSKSPWIQSRIDLIAKNCAKKDSRGSTYFLRNFSKEPWAETYLELSAKKYAKRNPFEFLHYLSEKPWAQPYIDLAVKNFIEKNARDFLIYFSEKTWAQPYIDLASKRFAEKKIEEHPADFLKSYSDEFWAQPYIDLAAKKCIEKEPSLFIKLFSEKSWANTPIESIGGKTWIEYAQIMQKKSSYNNNSLIKLSRALNDLGFNDYGHAVKKLSKY